MKSDFVKNMIKNMPEDVKLFSSLYADLIVRINESLKSQNISKKELAERLDKNPSEISKWLNGNHNLTLKSICKLQVELGVKLIEIPKKEILVEEKLSLKDINNKTTLVWTINTSTKSYSKNISFHNENYNKTYKNLVVNE